MTALLEFKQKIKNFYGQSEAILLPVLKFLFALGYFIWINQTLGYMPQLNNYFLVLILALICSIAPSGATVFVGYLLMIAHCYAASMEVAAFLLVLILFMMLLFLRFSAGRNIVVAFAPLAYFLNVPVLLPIGCGLLFNVVSVIPAACGIILYYFIRLVNFQIQALQDPNMLPIEKVVVLADGMVTNWAMWLNVIAVVAVIVLVYLIRTRSFDYAWRIAIVCGGIAYICVMLGGGYFMGVKINMVPLIVFTIIAVLIGLFLEFSVFGGDYTRVERLSFEDDDYYYYVKAVPKSSVSTSERNIKKINAEPDSEDEEKALTYANPIFRGEEKKEAAVPDENTEPLLKNEEIEEIDFKKKLEESLRDL